MSPIFATRFLRLMVTKKDGDPGVRNSELTTEKRTSLGREKVCKHKERKAKKSSIFFQYFEALRKDSTQNTLGNANLDDSMPPWVQRPKVHIALRHSVSSEHLRNHNKKQGYQRHQKKENNRLGTNSKHTHTHSSLTDQTPHNKKKKIGNNRAVYQSGCL